jgi:dephospho-CoA kinase
MKPSSTSSQKKGRGASPLIVGLTGSIGSGKSQAAEFFRELGAAIIDADVLAREVVAPGTPGLEAIRKKFGEGVILASGELDRKALGQLIFLDPPSRKQLEDILHPRIRELYLSRLNEQRNSPTAPPLIIYVVPLLFESRYSYPELDVVVVVSAPKSLSVERIMRRDGSPRELAESKYASQLPIEEKERQANYVLKNDSTIEELKKRVKDLTKKLLASRNTRGE